MSLISARMESLADKIEKQVEVSKEVKEVKKVEKTLKVKKSK